LSFNNYNLHLLNIDTNLIKERIPLPEIFIFIRNSILFLSIIGCMKFMLTKYQIIEISLKMNKNLPQVMYETASEFVKTVL